jgi:hypothetical protein
VTSNRVSDLVERLSIDGERDVGVLRQRDVAGFAIGDQVIHRSPAKW